MIDINKEYFIMIFGISMVVITLVNIIRIRKRYKYIYMILHKKNEPKLYIKEIDKYLRKNKSYYSKQILLLQKSVGLIYLGKWEKALNLIESLDFMKGYGNWKIIYYFNYLL